MRKVSSISQLPRVPAVYALYGGDRPYVAYVGIANVLKDRIIQHLVKRDSSVATGTSASCLKPDYVTEVRWWEHLEFAQRDVLEAAERVAFEVLDPALRSRLPVNTKAQRLYATQQFCDRMRPLFEGLPTGHLMLPSLVTVLERIEQMEHRLEALEKHHPPKNKS